MPLAISRLTEYIYVLFITDKSSNLIRYTHVFPHNVTDAGQENSDVSCCSTETTRSNCSLQYCNCSVEDQINCFINDNLNRFHLHS